MKPCSRRLAPCFADARRPERNAAARGERLRELIEQRCAGLAELVAQVRARLPEVQVRIRTRLNERVAELLATVDHERLEQEIVLRCSGSTWTRSSIA